MSLSIKAALQTSPQTRPVGPGTRQGVPGRSSLFGTLGSLFKKGLSSVGTSILGALTGGAGGARGQGIPFPPGGIVQHVPRGGIQLPPDLVVPKPGVGAFFERLIPGGATGLQVQAANGLAPPRGFHVNKSSYFLKDGTFIEKGSVFVKNRRRNPLNPRALRNAIGRVDAGKVWQGKLAEISTGKFTAAGNRKACPS